MTDLFEIGNYFQNIHFIIKEWWGILELEQN